MVRRTPPSLLVFAIAACAGSDPPLTPGEPEPPDPVIEADQPAPLLQGDT